MIRTKSVYSPIDRSKDGLRVLVTRFRGRFLSKNRYNVWMSSLGPSERLLRYGQSGRLTWEEFSRRYTAELFAKSPVDARNRLIKNHAQKLTLRLLNALAAHRRVTLMCHCDEDQMQCHRHVLRKLLLRRDLRA
jgi:uncharacterized protein YeaO (DUF488 family)